VQPVVAGHPIHRPACPAEPGPTSDSRASAEPGPPKALRIVRPSGTSCAAHDKDLAHRTLHGFLTEIAGRPSSRPGWIRRVFGRSPDLIAKRRPRPTARPIAARREARPCLRQVGLHQPMLDRWIDLRADLEQLPQRSQSSPTSVSSAMEVAIGSRPSLGREPTRAGVHAIAASGKSSSRWGIHNLEHGPVEPSCEPASRTRRSLREDLLQDALDAATDRSWTQ
jgi:hypothetical protein